MTTYRIKPLAWQHVGDDWWEAETVFGRITVERSYGKTVWQYCFDEYHDEGKHACDSVEDGKRAAEEFYLGRLLPALEVLT